MTAPKPPLAHDEQLKAFEERMAKKKEAEAAEDAEKSEKLRQQYLKRTGRTEIKP